MAETQKHKTVINLTKAEKRLRHRKTLAAMERLTLENASGKRFLSLSYQGASKVKVWRFLKGMADALVVSPPEKVQVHRWTAQDRLKRTWFRTGMALQLAMDEHDRTDLEEDEQHSEIEFLQAADS